MTVIPWIFEPELETLGLLSADSRTHRQRVVDFQVPNIRSPELGIVQVFLEDLSFHWSYIFNLARSMRNHCALGLNDTGFMYAKDFTSWELEEVGYFEEVAIYAPFRAQVQMSLAVFERLMLRFFYAAMESAHRYKYPILHHPRFVQFIKDINQIERRLEEESKKVA